MGQTIIGVFIGISTSFIAGILLIWKGDQFVSRLKNLPGSRRVRLFTTVYLRALHGYPYRFLHYLIFVGVLFVVIATFLGYVSLTYAAFTAETMSRDAVRNAWHILLPDFFSFGFFRWFVATATILCGVWLIPGFRRTFSVEVLVPYAYRDVERVRQCVLKCGSPEQFVAYVDAENKAKNLSDLKALFDQARAIIGNRFALVDEILASLGDSENRPGTEALDDQNAAPPLNGR